MKVKIVKCSDRENSYGHLVGKVFEVYNSNHIVDGNCVYNVSNKDTIPVSEIRYELKSTVIYDTCVTSCEHKKNTMVGSVGCSECEYNCGNDKEAKTVQCSWQKESKEMDLKSIAVKFENVEQREVIRSVFKEKGFKVLEIMSTGGVIGYADGDDYGYVCSLSTIGLIGKTIISYEEFIGGKEMKRLEVSLKIQPDGKTVVAECTHIAEELRGKGVLAEKDGHKINSAENLAVSYISNTLYVRGSARHLDYKVDYRIFESSQEAQEYVRIMNELIDEINNPKIDWSKVEEGAEVKVTTECSRYGANFHSYIPNMKKIVVIVGDEVKVVDEDKVELV